MHKKLLLMAFEKVRQELRKEGIKSASVMQCAQRLSTIISESFAYGERRLRDFYNEAKKKEEGDINIPQKQVVLSLLTYLGYESYSDFENKNSIASETNTRNTIEKVNKQATTSGILGFNKHNRIFLISSLISILLALGFLGYHYYNKQKWMEWGGTHYVDASFDAQKLKEGNLKLYKEEMILNFKKIKPDCDTEFFNGDGSVRVWYGKNNEGEYEYFSSYGIHPNTGKTLRPITTYIIEKYVCKE